MTELAFERISGLTVLQPVGTTELSGELLDENVVRINASANDRRPSLRLEVDLADAAGYWQPGGRSPRLLAPDWAGPTVTSLVRSAPVGALYSSDGRVLLGWAASEAVSELEITYGVSEERKSFVVQVQPTRPLGTDLTLVLDGSRAGLVDTVRRLCTWTSEQCRGEPLVPPPVARRPVYSTWYTFAQDVSAELVGSEATLAVELGCGSVFIDDGWQQHGRGRGYQGCGDWLPDLAKFPDLAATVGSVHDTGAAVALWIAPLLLGPDSGVHDRLSRFAPYFAPSLRCQVLDPRHLEVRRFAVETCLRLVEDYQIDLLKIDFLDQAMVYGAAPGDGGGSSDIGQAMADLLADLRQGLAEAGQAAVAFEFRQPYVSPAVARYGQILRAGDCPGDSMLNRISTIDARLVSVGQVAHSDPMMWGPGGGAEAVAQQLYAGWFGVPQISMRLSALSHEQGSALQGLLALWSDHAAVTLDGELEVLGAEHGYHLVRAKRADLRRTVTARYAPLVVDLPDQADHETTVLNATPDPRLVLRTTHPLTRAIVRGPDASEIPTSTNLGPGLVEFTVPPFGSLSLRT
jgi:melibiase-like protein